MASSLKKDQSKIGSIRQYRYVINGRKRIQRWNMSCYMKDHNKNKESPYLKYCDVNRFYGLVMSQTLPVNNVK